MEEASNAQLYTSPCMDTNIMKIVLNLQLLVDIDIEYHRLLILSLNFERKQKLYKLQSLLATDV